jgi:protein arginine kinase
MKISTILKTRGDWLSADGAQHPIVISSRVRLARNLAKLPFPGWAKKTERIRILDEIKPEVDNLAQMRTGFSEQLNELSALEKQVLVERHLISREHAAKGMGSAAAISSSQAISIMMNEEDHLRMQAMSAGLDLQKTFRIIDDVDTALEAHLDFAFEAELGYLTACPTNVGTGMRASAMVHLPGLVLSEQINQVINSINKIGLAVRGLYGEGTDYRTPEQGDRHVNPAGEPVARESSGNKAHHVDGSSRESVRNFDSRLFSFFKGSIELAFGYAPGD